MAAKLPYNPTNEFTEEWVEYDGVRFVTQCWKVPEGVKYRGKIIYVHGFCETRDLYVEAFDKFTHHGYEVFFFEQRGAGDTSPGNEIGKTEEKYVFGDLDFFIKRNLDQRKDPAEKLILMGHSMGGAIVLNYGIKGTYREEFKAIVASAPLILLHPLSEPHFIIKFVGSYLSKLLPRIHFPAGLQFDYMTSDPDWKNYIQNSGARFVTTLRQANDFFKRGEALVDPEWVSNFSQNIYVCVLHGDSDNINWDRGSERFMELLPEKTTKEFHHIDGGLHSMYMERETVRVEFFEKVFLFLDSH